LTKKEQYLGTRTLTDCDNAVLLRVEAHPYFAHGLRIRY
jgi:hypothetical protein